jgi:hypothetical protein
LKKSRAFQVIHQNIEYLLKNVSGAFVKPHFPVHTFIIALEIKSAKRRCCIIYFRESQFNIIIYFGTRRTRSK